MAQEQTLAREGAVQPGQRAGATQAAVGAPSARPRTTPRLVRPMLPRILIALAALAITATIAGIEARQSAAALAENTAPALIALQDLSSSAAEANAEATASFLVTDQTGTAERLHHNAFLDALRRSSEQAEEVSARIGPNQAAHDALKTVSSGLGSFNGAIEAARVENLNRLPGAKATLGQGLDVADNEIATAIDDATAAAQGEVGVTDGWSLWAARAAGAVALGLLIQAQLVLARRTRRVFSPLLVIATVLTLAVALAFEAGFFLRNSAIADARTGGYDAIAETASIQSDAFALQAAVGRSLIDDRPADLTELEARIDAGVNAVGAGADSDRERAAADELAERWAAYRSSIGTITGTAASDPATAAGLYQGDGLSAFNGFNTTVDSVLLDNRLQFVDSLERGAGWVSFLPYLGIVLPVLAALAALLGIQRRLEQYR